MFEGRRIVIALRQRSGVTVVDPHFIPSRAHRAAEGGERACNADRQRNAECY